MKEKYETVMDAHPEVATWLKDRPTQTKRAFSGDLMQFSETVAVAPEDWRHLDKFKARDLAWQVVEPLKKQHSAKAVRMMAALKSWYRNLNGELLPLDSGRGGKHNIRVVQKKATYEHKLDKPETYQLIDMAGNLRDRAVFLCAFQSGVRRNVFQKLTYGMVQKHLNQDIIMLKITWDIDDKLRGANIPFYITFLNGEAVVTLRKYCEVYHKDSKPDTPLFYAAKSKRPINPHLLLKAVQKCARRLGPPFMAEVKGKLVPAVWFHSFRKAFRKVVRQANIDDDDKEQLMGHAIRGSREAYYDKTAVDIIQRAYEKCNFSREVPQSETAKLKKQLEEEQTKRAVTDLRLEKLEKELEATRSMLKEMLEKQA